MGLDSIISPLAEAGGLTDSGSSATGDVSITVGGSGGSSTWPFGGSTSTFDGEMTARESLLLLGVGLAAVYMIARR